MDEKVVNNTFSLVFSINSIPSIEDIQYIRNKHVSHLPSYKKINKNINNICTICFEQYIIGEYYRILPNCQHIYHKKCIDKWFKKDKDMKCPNCRINYLKLT